MGKRIELYVLRPAPVVLLDGNPVKLEAAPLELLIYLALEKKRYYQRETLSDELFGWVGNPDYLRTAVLGKFDKRIKSLILLPKAGQGKLEYSDEHVSVDALEFEAMLEQVRLLPVGSPRYEALLLEAYHCYQGDFLAVSPFCNSGWLQKQQQHFSEKLYQLFEMMVQYYILYGQYELALNYAERWSNHLNPGYLPWQYLLWLALTLQQRQLVERGLAYLETFDTDKPLMGLSVQGWQQLNQKREMPSLSLLGLQAIDISVNLLRPDINDSTLPIEVLSSEGDIASLVSSAKKAIRQGNNAQAQAMLDQARTFSEMHGLERFLSEIFHQQAILKMQQADYGTAEAFYQQALDYLPLAAYHNQESVILSNAGVNAFYKGAYTEAIKCLSESYTAADSFQQDVVKGYVKSTLGVIAIHLNDEQKAFLYYHNAWDIFEKIQHDEQSGCALLNLAYLRYGEGRLQLAELLLTQAGERLQKYHYPQDIGIYGWYQGALLAALRRFSEAEMVLRQAAEPTVDSGLSWLNWAIQIEQAKVYLCQNMVEHTYQLLEEVFWDAKTKGNLEYTVKSLYGLCLASLSETNIADQNRVAIKYLGKALPRAVLDHLSLTLPIPPASLDQARKLFQRGMTGFIGNKYLKVIAAFLQMISERKGRGL